MKVLRSAINKYEKKLSQYPSLFIHTRDSLIEEWKAWGEHSTLDNFKAINDLHGHRAGDCVLTASVHYLIEHLRPYDKVFRYDGEEFLLLMQHTELAFCHDMMERLREGLASMSIDFDGKKPITITASFGMARLDPDAPVKRPLTVPIRPCMQQKPLGGIVYGYGKQRSKATLQI